MRKANWIYLVVFLLVTSCRQLENVDFTNVKSVSEIGNEDAIAVSSNFLKLVGCRVKSNDENANARKNADGKIVKAIKTFRDSQQRELYYVIVYEKVDS